MQFLIKHDEDSLSCIPFSVFSAQNYSFSSNRNNDPSILMILDTRSSKSENRNIIEKYLAFFFKSTFFYYKYYNKHILSIRILVQDNFEILTFLIFECQHGLYHKNRISI